MLIVDQNVLDDISKGFAVPAQPQLLLNLLKLMADPYPNINAIADCISQDIAVSAAILKAVNSPLYGLDRTITDIKMSVKYIGIYGVVMLITNSLIKKSFDPKNCSINLEDFWRTTTDISNATVAIGKRFKQNIAMDKLSSLGLFHDCGIPVMAMKHTNYQAVVEQLTLTSDLSLITLEEQHFQVNHAILGYYVASSWRLPKDVCQIILQHHERDYLDKINGSPEQDLFAILKLAEHVVSLKNLDEASSDWPYLEKPILSILGIKKEELPETILQINGAI
ncbi:HDOD domain-containing protein [Colwellia sp. 4_MG-2023]|jgi:HD-like signal output (HDOD) protein|uniref:HDOD domain-containing protein n=1 Tax=unclassified Colwellia TaxID=196834 RepID=UPI001C09180C|nr:MULTISPECIES: HDOD domain-containing protein [unclassified Colwellia]MBU2925176.1 HDOD domain-containing protein [Colwellia sp. C2M11]MDO6486675.1 HDOD domain-containing protein [Colwellia sp. 6_MG-2023]MDO6506744.1 HDOD domain-containing protein [Colwellia sp. 5_MG-2023]MDO6555570.1 HDOD domain-containing protein [Colwellia sp. 4_MG-2023]MDO6651299.1 HDOD domain-containing protein [Colwellia sp. 3_MG-2023]